jgi:hypothetical protein
VDNTALGGFWRQQFAAYDAKTKHEPLCSQCDPTIGKWHEQFPRKLAEGYVQDKSGNIYLPDEAARYFKHLGPFKPVVLPATTPERP